MHPTKKNPNQAAFSEPDVNHSVITTMLANYKQLNQREMDGEQTGNEARVKIIF